MRKRFLSVLMALALVLSLLPISAMASEPTGGVTTQEALETAIEAAPAGGTVQLDGDISVTLTIQISKEITLDLAGHTISNPENIWDDDVNAWSLVSVRAGGDLTITGGGTFQAKENDCYAVDVMDGGTCTIESGTFVGNIHAVYVLSGALVVSGGTFSVQQKYSDPAKADEFVLNCYDDHYRKGSASILVTGGVFVNFDPSNCQAEGAGTCFMSVDCKSEAAASGGDTVYTVTKNDTITVDKPASASDGTVSASVGGVTVPTDSEGDVVASGQTVTVDAKVDGASDVTVANVTVGGGALTAVRDAASVSSLAIVTDVGTLIINGEALDAIAANATVGSTVTDVTLCIRNTTAQGSAASAATYELTAVDAGGDEVFSSGNAGGTITVTVPAPTDQEAASGTYYVYYLGADGAELVTSMEPDADGNISWDAGHFSTYYVTATEQKISVSDEEGNTATYDTLQEAIDNADAGDTVKLLDNVTVNAPSGEGSGLAAITIDRDITLDGGGNTIGIGTGFAATGGDGWDKDLGKYHVINITSDATIQNVTIDGGWDGVTETSESQDYSAARSGINIWNNDPTQLVVTLDGVDVKNCSTYAVTAWGADLTITAMDTEGNQWGVDVEDNSNADISSSNIPEDIVYESSSAGSSLAIAGGDYGNVKVQQQDDVVTTGTVTVENATVDQVVTGGENVSEATATISVTGSTVGTVTNGSAGTFSVVDSRVGNGASIDGESGIIMVGCVDGDGADLADVAPEGIEAMIDGTTYSTFEAAVAAAQDDDVIILLNDVALDGSGKGNNEGLVTITRDITIEGNGKTITAGNVTADADTAAGPSMISIQDGANVTVRDLAIDGAGGTDAATDNVKHGLNIYGDGTTVTVVDVVIKNGNGYAIVANGADVTVDGLTTENNGWGGVNVDSKSGAASLTIVEADISESNSVKIENTSADTTKPADPTVKIQGGSFKDVVLGDSIDADTYQENENMVVSGGTFAGGGEEGAVDIADYLADGLAIDGNGTVYTPSQGGSGGSGVTRYEVSVPSGVEGGKVAVSSTRASRGSTVTVTVTPDEGYELDTLTATDADGNELTLTDRGDGEYTFTMPRSKVEITASFKAVEDLSGFPFTDVSSTAWYYDAVVYAWENDLMTGTSAATFAPGMTTDRAMLATLLWRLEGSPSVDYLMDFDDVAEGLWYSEAVRWAASEGVVTGVGDGSSFAPTGAITREQMAVMLYRYAQYKGYDVTGSADLSGYADADSVSSWAEYAVAWAVDAGLISGVGNNTLNPQGSATRAEIATILMRFVETFVPAE